MSDADLDQLFQSRAQPVHDEAGLDAIFMANHPATAKGDATTPVGAALTGLGAGLAAGFDDEIGGGEQAALAALAKHAPWLMEKFNAIAPKSWEIETRYPEGLDDPSQAYDSAVKGNRVEKRLAAKEHPWAYGVGDVAGSSVTGALAAGAGLPVGAIAQGALQGGARALGEGDEGRGLNVGTAEQVAAGAGLGAAGAWAGGKLAEGVGWMGQKASAMANSARGRMSDRAMTAAAKEVVEHNGALGPEQAGVNRDIEYLEQNDPEQLRGLKAKVAGIKAQQATVKRQNVVDFEKGEPKELTDELFRRHLLEVENTGKEAFMGAGMRDIGKGLAQTPVVGPIAKGAYTIGRGAVNRYLANDVVKAGLGDKVSKAFLSNPSLVERYGSAVFGASVPSVAHQILQQKDPEYREALRQAAEDDNGH